MRWALTYLLLSMPLASAHATTIAFDRLNNCDDLAAGYRYVHATPPMTQVACRPPQSQLELVMVQHMLTPTAHAFACLVSDPPIPSLRLFSCILDAGDDPAWRGFTCFRPMATGETIAELRENYRTKYGKAVLDYTTAITRCSVSNKDATVAQSTLFPQSLSWLARFEFAFVAGLGTGQPTQSVASHGWATLNPALAVPGVDGLEYVEFYFSTVQSMGADASAGINADKRVFFEFDDGVDDGIQKLANLGQYHASSKVLSGTIRSGTNHAGDVEKPGARGAVIEAIRTTARATLERHGFALFPEGRLLREVHSQYKSFADMLKSQKSYGGIQASSEPTTVEVFLYDGSACRATPNDLIMAMVSSTPDDRYTFARYGRFDIVLVATGKCSEKTKLSISRILAFVRDRLLEELK